MFEKPEFEQAVRELEEELGREPTTQETNERMADIAAKAIDDAYENHESAEDTLLSAAFVLLHQIEIEVKSEFPNRDQILDHCKWLRIELDTAKAALAKARN